jgi:CheY-like chemotaxis protein
MWPTPRGPVLVVEDNDETRAAVVRILAIKGVPSVAASDGYEALDYLRSGGTASVIVLDLRMPLMDGLAVRRELAANPAWARIPIVVFSAVLPDAPIPGVVASVHKGTDDPDVLLDAIARACAPGATSGPRGVSRSRW